MNIGIVCYASVGGSGVIATELARHLAARDHHVHVLSADLPFRLRENDGGVVFHRVETPAYPLFREPQYLLALSTRIVDVARTEGLDLVHAHYAVPHATAAWLATAILKSRDGAAPKVVTTLHGTDITLIGSDPSYRETVAFSIEQSDAVTAVSESLRNDTLRDVAARRDIHVVPNFVDVDRYRRGADGTLRARLCGEGCDSLIVHVSNMRPVKRLEAVVEVFRLVRQEARARLILAGEGPELPAARSRLDELGLLPYVDFLGEQANVVDILSVADVFLLPSSQESFGLAALEAMACEVPVVASRVGGLPEVVEDQKSGFLHAPDDLTAMAASTVHLLTDPQLGAEMGRAAREAAVTKFRANVVVPEYERIYRSLTGRS